jgi:negative regulator of sigma E activity
MATKLVEIADIAPYKVRNCVLSGERRGVVSRITLVTLIEASGVPKVTFEVCRVGDSIPVKQFTNLSDALYHYNFEL